MASRCLRWIKAGQAAHGPRRWLRRLAVGAWKAARRLPLAGHIRVGLLVDGHAMRVRAFSYDDLLTASEHYEPCLAAILPPAGGVAVDAGAFIGRHTLAYARAVGPHGRVIAVEPLSTNFRLLEENVCLNGYRQVTCVPCALGRDEREVWLGYDRETSIASTVYSHPYRQRVRQQSLDQLLATLGVARIDLLKIDVEGAEYEVLEGSQRTLAASPLARLIIEIHPQPGAPPGAACPVEAWLTQRGYAVRKLQEGKRLFYLASSDNAAAAESG